MPDPVHAPAQIFSVLPSHPDSALNSVPAAAAVHHSQGHQARTTSAPFSSLTHSLGVRVLQLKCQVTPLPNNDRWWLSSSSCQEGQVTQLRSTGELSKVLRAIFPNESWEIEWRRASRYVASSSFISHTVLSHQPHPLSICGHINCASGFIFQGPQGEAHKQYLI